jgi:hypothetical protein
MILREGSVFTEPPSFFLILKSSENSKNFKKMR